MVKLIGTAANQVPVNGMLGNMAYQNKEGAFIDLLGLAAGTAAAPSLIPSGDPNTGVWFPAADTIAASTNGSERLRVDSSGNVGIGTTGIGGSANDRQLTLQGPSSAQTSFVAATSSVLSSVGVNSTIAYIGSTSNHPLTFFSNNTERMRIDASGNVGIGTSSPGSRLNISGGNVYIQTSGTYSEPAVIAGVLSFDSVGGDFTISSRSNGGATNLKFHTSSGGVGTEKMRINSAGNVFIGGTSTVSPLTLNKAVYLQSSTDNDIIGYNLFINDGSNNRRAAMFLDDANGLLGWDVTASSGVPDYVWRTASVERMRITEAGNLLIGTSSSTGYKVVNYTAVGSAVSSGDTSSSYELISGASRTGTSVVSSSYATTLVLQSNTDTFSANTGASIGFQGKWNSSQYASAAQFSSIFGGKENGTDANLAGYLSFATRPAGGNPTERMRIDSAGNVGIGTTSPAAQLTVNGSGGIFSATGYNYATISTLTSSADAVFGGGMIADTGVSSQVKKTTADPAHMIRMQISDGIAFHTNFTGAAGTSFARTANQRMSIDVNGNVVINTAAVATTATNGFLYVPGCAGAPTGVPTAYAGRVPIVVDTTNNKLYFYSGGAWRDAGP